MELTQCPHGHYYDREKYASCPHCQAAGMWPPTDPHTPAWPPGPLVPPVPPVPPFPPVPPVPPVPTTPRMPLPKPWEDCHIEGRLGQGGTADVYRLRRVTDYALKVIPKTKDKAAETARREYEIAGKLADCEHVIRYLDH